MTVGTGTGDDATEQLYRKVKLLNELLWEDRTPLPVVDKWLANFTGEKLDAALERKHALYLLSKFLYFGQTQVREMLRAMFRDLFHHHLSSQVKRAQPNRSPNAVHEDFLKEFHSTRFLGLGNPAESGTHILYDFRLMNRIPLTSFVNFHNLFTGALDDTKTEWADPSIQRIVFIDDFCGTGDQASAVGDALLPVLKNATIRAKVGVKTWYLTMFATTAGLERVRSHPLFDRVATVSEFDPTYRAFGSTSQYYRNPPPQINKDQAHSIARHYGSKLIPGHPLGYECCQLLLGFHHNIPDNTLPVFSREIETLPWRAIFPRFEKIGVYPSDHP